MKRINKVIVNTLLILLFLLLLLGISCNCEVLETTQSPSATDISGKSFIWEISSNVTSVYLMGSVHVAHPDIYPLDSTIENAFEMADNLVVEINVTDVNELHISLLVMKYGKYTKGKGLKDVISEDEKLQEKVIQLIKEEAGIV